MQHCVRFYCDEDGHPVKPGAPHVGIEHKLFADEMMARMWAADLEAVYGVVRPDSIGRALQNIDTRFSPVQDYGASN